MNYPELALFNYFNGEIVKIKFLNEVILRKAGFGMMLKICDVGFEPDWFFKVKFQTDKIESGENFMSSA